jgi:uncharacterized protein YbjT (DUF2867 family)
MSTKRSALVTGATGLQGGAVARAAVQGTSPKGAEPASRIVTLRGS